MAGEFRTLRLSPDYRIKNFDCGNAEINDFLHNDSFDYLNRRLSVTYVVETDDDTVAFFSLSNDKIAQDESSNGTWRKIKQLFPHRKHRRDYPAVKIGRLGVSTKYACQGIGTEILGFVKKMFITNNRTGCCFVTVDAYQESEGFYTKNGFRRLNPTEKVKGDDTILMFYDLQELV
jgi:GNAT superfamily N-acetyltransferase